MSSSRSRIRLRGLGRRSYFAAHGRAGLMSEVARRAAIAFAVGVLSVAAVVAAATSGGGAGEPDAGVSSTDRWRQLRSSPLERTEVAAARIGKRIYVVGGFEKPSGETTDAVARYNIKRDRWKLVKPMPIAANHPAATSHRGRLYIHGGFTSAGGLSDPSAALSVYN